MTLSPETVHRELPALRSPEDRRLFASEAEKTFSAVETRFASGWFYPVGWQDDFLGSLGLLRRSWYHLGARPAPAPVGPTLVATDRFSNGYFHWLTEALPRLWWIREALGSRTLVLPHFADRLSYMVESLAIFPELRWIIVPPQSRWKLADALVVPEVATPGNYRPDLVRAVGQSWRSRVGNPTPQRLVYVSRSQAPRRRLVNESSLMDHLSPRGFELVHLEGLPFADQVRRLAETRHLVSVHGAGLANMLFMAPGTKVTEIRRADDAHNNCYFSLARALGLEYDYRLARPADPSSSAHDGDLVLDPSEFL